jgi:nucleotide-binding universal stress UspA family protein
MSGWDRICCAVDFSESSRRALEQAVALARWCDAELHLLHVHTRPSPSAVDLLSTGFESVEAGEAVEAELASWAELAGQGLQRRVRPALEVGSAPTRIVEFARTAGIDLLVLATHGRTGLPRVLTGSVAERVVRLAPCPVLVVRGGGAARPEGRAPAPDAAGGPGWHRILCVTGLGEGCRVAVEQAAELARAHGAALHLLHVRAASPTPGPSSSEGPAAASQVSRVLEEHRLAAERRVGAPVQATIVAGAVVPEVLRAVREGRHDLLVVGVRRRPHLGWLVLGSAASRLVREASCAVLVARGEADARAARAGTTAVESPPGPG